MARTVSDISEDLPIDLGEYYLEAGGEEEGGGEYYVSPVPFRYRTEDFVSRPFFSEFCDLEENILEFDFSYGYDARRPNNLVVLDEKTLVFASGNFINFFDVETKEIWFRRSAVGGGIGHITRNTQYTSFPHIAVAENGTKPPIIIYEWPSLEIVTVLKNGTLKRYTNLAYSPDGLLLASQGGEPDYMLTIWNWPKSVILLRTKSHVNDVKKIMFSPDIPGQLTSCGVAHIKFWKMARTFTGLKLQGELGRFGKTEYSDIVGIYPMADEKVVSGCYWGNILVWEDGLIKLEVCRKGRKRCHDAQINQITYKHGELWTVGADGHVKMWFYDTIDQADPPDEDRFVIMEPTYDFHTAGAMFMCIEKQYPELPDHTMYFAQDGRGGIWLIDLNIEDDVVTAPPERLIRCHAGMTVGLDVCPWGNYFSSLGNGGRCHIYDYVERKLLIIHPFPAPGCQIIWLPLSIDASGEVLLVALDDGTLRVCVVKINEETDPKEVKFNVIQITKPHLKYITCMKLSRCGRIVVTGSEDCTLFIQKIVPVEPDVEGYIKLEPIGYINTPDIPSCIAWHNTEDTVMFIGHQKGFILTVDFPTEPLDYTTITYILTTVKPMEQRFYSYKSQIRRDIELAEIAKQKQKKRDVKAVELAQIRRDNPGLQIESDIFLADSESTVDLGPLFMPEPNKILFLMHTEDDTLWLSMAGFDAGYIYELQIGQEDPVPYKCTMVFKSDDIEINNYCYNKTKEYLLFGMQNGAIRVHRVNQNDWHDLSNYWELTMHENTNGFIPSMKFSYDETYFFSCGHDCNIFSFRFFPDYTISEPPMQPSRNIPDPSTIVPLPDTSWVDELSYEQAIVKKELDRINFVANQHKQEYLRELSILRNRYEHQLVRNAALPESQRIPLSELKIDIRIENDLEEKLSTDINLVKRKLAYDVAKSRVKMEKLKHHFIDCMDKFPIRVTLSCGDSSVRCIKMRALGEYFDETLEEVIKRIDLAELKSRPVERAAPPPPKVEEEVEEKAGLEYFLFGLSPEVIAHGLGKKIERLLAKYRERRDAKHKREREWAIFNEQKPNVNSTDADDEAMLKHAAATVGDLKLKTAPDYKVPPELRETTYKKYKELLLVRRRQYDLAHNFNELVYDMRREKEKTHEYLMTKAQILDSVRKEIKVEDWLPIPTIFELTPADYPEKEYEVNVIFPGSDVEAEEDVFILSNVTSDIKELEVLQLYPYTEPVEEEVDSDWEISMRADRYRWKLFEQSEVIQKMETKESEFNKKITRLRLQRIREMVKLTFLTLHLLTLNQELFVLKDCENNEQFLTDTVANKWNELLDLKDVIDNFNAQMQDFQKQLEKLDAAEKQINKNFMSAVAENKFFKFLHRIFRKKYKPPKVKSDDDSDSSSSDSDSSSSSSEEDAESIDSKDFAIVRLDENVCPKGCEQNLYDLTFELRGERHEIEFSRQEINKKMEALQKELDAIGKKYRAMEISHATSQTELEEYQRQKQKKLNEILCTIILRRDQCQNLDAQGKLCQIRDSVLMLKPALTSLYKRVTQLDMDTQQQIAKHKLSYNHLQRLNNDQRFMLKDIQKWKNDIKELMIQKFGSICDPEELEDYLLKSYIFNLKLSLAKIDQMFASELERWYQMHKRKQKDLARSFHNHTKKLSLLSTLHQEKMELSKVCLHQSKIKSGMDHMIEFANQLKAEVAKLDEIVREQNKEIELLKKEIKLYKTKGYALRPEKHALEEEVEAAEEIPESEVSEWHYVSEYMFTECYARAYWKDQDMKETLRARQDVVMSIIDELLENLRIEVTRLDVVKLLKVVLSDIMTKVDIRQIIDDILNLIPYKPDDKILHSAIELSAEKLYCLEDDVALDGSAANVARSVLICILDDILTKDNISDGQKLPILVNTLTDNLPLDILLEEENMQTVLEKMKESDLVLGENSIIGEEKVESVQSKVLLSEIYERLSVEEADANLEAEEAQ